jgi:hypothetical protein
MPTHGHLQKESKAKEIDLEINFFEKELEFKVY